METGIEMNVGEIDLQSVMDAYYEGKPSRPSRRMGASSIGHPCKRAIWLKFHWAIQERFEGQQLRTFELGHILEDAMANTLKDMGWVILYTGKEQVELEITPHLVCYPDGLIISGVPTAEKTEHAWDNKIMADSWFKQVRKKGIRAVYPKYYTQIQLEMYGLSKKLGRKIDRGLITCINRDTSQVYAERFKYDPKEIEKVFAIEAEVRESQVLPKGISENPSWMECKMCSCSHFCHLSHEVMAVNCRTCAHSTAEEDGTWSCRLDRKYGWGIGALPFDAQKEGCPYHVFNPSLVPYPLHADLSTEDSACYEMPDGEIVLNGWEGVNSHDLWKTGRLGSEETQGEDISF